MPKKQFDFNNLTDVGLVRDNNEDYYAYFSCAYGECFVLCDGAGGYEGGEAASQLSVETIRQYIESTPIGVGPSNMLLEAIEKANAVVRARQVEIPKLKEMKTTCVAFLLHPGKDPKAWIAYVGDSRIYRIRQDTITQLSHDHSRVMEMVDRGLITKEEARNHPQSNIITRAIGATDTILPESKQVNVYRDDRFLMCSDGISDQLSDDEIFHLTRDKPGNDACKQLIALANNRGGPDNSTVQIVDILSGPKFKESKHSRKRSPRHTTLPLYLLSFFLGLVISFVVMKFLFINPMKTQISELSISNDSLSVADNPVAENPEVTAEPETGAPSTTTEQESEESSTDPLFTIYLNLDDVLKREYPPQMAVDDSTRVYHLESTDLLEVSNIYGGLSAGDAIHLVIENTDVSPPLYIAVLPQQPTVQEELCIAFGSTDEGNNAIDIKQDDYEELLDERIADLSGSFSGFAWILVNDIEFAEFTTDELQKLADIRSDHQEVEYFKVSLPSTEEEQSQDDTGDQNLMLL